MPRKKELKLENKSILPKDNPLKNFKEYLKKNPFQRVTKSKKGFISIDHSFSPYHPELTGVVLKVIATSGDWEKLESFTRDHPDRFGSEFHSHFAQPAQLEIHEKNKPRGMQTKRIQHLANEIKTAAGKLYAFNFYWCKKAFREWPEYLKQIIDAAKKEGHEDYLKPDIYKDKYAPRELTAFIIGKVYGLNAELVGLKPLFEYKNRESTENFYITYVQGKRGLSKNNFKLIKDKTPKEVSQLIYTDPTLEYIFLSFYLDTF